MSTETIIDAQMRVFKHVQQLSLLWDFSEPQYANITAYLQRDKDRHSMQFLKLLCKCLSF